MKQLIAIAGAMAAAISFGGNVCTYTGASATAPGDWADSGNWDVTPVGGNGDIIIIPSGKTAFIDASSVAVRMIVEGGFEEIKMIGRIGEAVHPGSLVVTVDEDDEPLTLNGKIHGYRNGADDTNADASSGLVVKKGKGALRLKPTLGGGDLNTNFTVEEGELYLPQEVSSAPNFHDICISNNATLHIAAKTDSKVNNNIYRLAGGGVVTNSHVNGYSDIQVHISGECEFAGRLTNVRLFGKGKVNLTGSESSMTSYVTAQASNGAGTIGLAKIGVKGDVSSVGVADRIVFGSGGGTFVYLGTGETTDKELCWQYPKTQKCFLSGGAHGGLVFGVNSLWNIAYTTVVGNKGMASLGLSGENPTNACVMAGAINASTDEAGRTNRLYITKTGRGIWRFGDNADREGIGGIAVEDGTLQFDTFAEKGVMCALGTAVDCHTNYYGTYDADANADYAFSAGSATTEGTFEYMGSDPVWVAQRPMVLNGDVRFKNNGGASFRFADVKPVTDGGKTVTLDGSGMGENVLADVFDNPSAPVSIVKEGAGIWMLANTNSIHGHIIVKGGTLKIASQSGKYTWFLWTLKDVLYPASVVKCSVSELCFYEKAEGYARANAGMESASSYAGIQPGQVAFFTVRNVSGSIDSMLDGVYMNNDGFRGAIDEKAPSYRDEATHIPVLMRFADSAPEIDRYDFSCRYAYKPDDAVHCGGNPKAWTLQGSVDGFHWDMLHEVHDATAEGCEMPARSNNNRFYAAGRNWESDMNTGTNAQVFASRATGANPLSEIASVQVVSNATLEATGDALEIGNIVVDIHSGGTFKNFKFAETGTIDINEKASGVHELPLSFENCTGIDRIAGWVLNVAGAPTAKRRISVSGGKVYVVPQGFVLSFR